MTALNFPDPGSSTTYDPGNGVTYTWNPTYSTWTADVAPASGGGGGGNVVPSFFSGLNTGSLDSLVIVKGPTVQNSGVSISISDSDAVINWTGGVGQYFKYPDGDIGCMIFKKLRTSSSTLDLEVDIAISGGPQEVDVYSYGNPKLNLSGNASDCKFRTITLGGGYCKIYNGITNTGPGGAKVEVYGTGFLEMDSSNLNLNTDSVAVLTA